MFNARSLVTIALTATLAGSSISWAAPDHATLRVRSEADTPDGRKEIAAGLEQIAGLVRTSVVGDGFDIHSGPAVVVTTTAVKIGRGDIEEPARMLSEASKIVTTINASTFVHPDLDWAAAMRRHQYVFELAEQLVFARYRYETLLEDAGKVFAAGLEQVQEFTLDSAEGRALAAQLGEKPAGATSLMWVSSNPVPQDRRLLNLYVADEIGLMSQGGVAVVLGGPVATYRLHLNNIPVGLGNLILELVSAKSALGEHHAPSIRFRNDREVGTLPRELVQIFAWHPAMQNHVIYWVPRSAQPVTLNGRDGYAFWV